MIALYVPQLLDGGVSLCLVLAVPAAALVAYLRHRHGLVFAGTFVLGGWIFAVLPGAVRSLSVDLGGYGDICREWNRVDCPDWVFSLYMYFDVGMGIIVSLLGMVGGAVLLAASGGMLRRVFRGLGPRHTANSEQASSGNLIGSH